MWNTDNSPEVVRRSYENVELKHVAKTMVNFVAQTVSALEVGAEVFCGLGHSPFLQ